MSTDYRLKLISRDGTTAEITVIDSINPLPGSDTWQGDQAQWNTKGGAVSSWGADGTYLTGPLGANSIFLDHFGKNTNVSDTGDGQKNYDGGSFPQDSFRWECLTKT